MNRFALAVLALVVGQSLFLGAMVWDRVSLLRSENVVTLKTAPVDPRAVPMIHKPPTARARPACARGWR